jgi:hypothetical protein
MLSLIFHILNKFIITRINSDGVLNHCQIDIRLKKCAAGHET